MSELIKELLSKFVKTLKIENRSEMTIKSYTHYLKKFFEYLEREKDISSIDKVTKEILDDYRIYKYEQINIRGGLNSVSEQNNVLGAIKQFFRFLKEREYIVSNPAVSIPYAKAPKRLPRSILSRSEVRKILHTPDLKSTIGYRDRTILEILYSTGIRKSELGNLDITDVDYHDGLVRIQGKGDKERIVPVGKIACRYLENYIKSVRPELIRDPYNNALFLTLKGNRFTADVLLLRIRKYAEKAKLKKKVTPHTFRHTCATAMLKNRADIRSIQELLGHASLDSTQVYTKVTITDLKEIHRRCHPRERDKE